MENNGELKRFYIRLWRASERIADNDNLKATEYEHTAHQTTGTHRHPRL